MTAVRRAELRDVPEILELNFKLFQQDYVWDNTLDMEWTWQEKTKSFFEKSIESEDDCWRVAEEDNKIVGYMAFSTLKTPSWMDKKLKMAELEHTYILEDYRGRSLGHQMFAECQKWAEKRGCNLLTVTASYKNAKAQSFYEKEGFVKTDITLQKKI